MNITKYLVSLPYANAFRDTVFAQGIENLIIIKQEKTEKWLDYSKKKGILNANKT